jgi:hypothetical protein
MLASYTWSHALDVTTDSNGGGSPMNPYNWRGDYGNSNWDLRHRFIASFNYELPFLKSAGNPFVRQAFAGWQTNGIVNLQSGFPFNVTIPGDTANTGVGSQRPNLVSLPSSNCGNGRLTNCIDPAAFALPAAYTYGNADRNLLYGPGLYNIDFSAFKTSPSKRSPICNFAQSYSTCSTRRPSVIPTRPTPTATLAALPLRSTTTVKYNLL